MKPVVSEEKIAVSYRLKKSAFDELNALEESSAMDKTQIVEIAIMNVRPLIRDFLRQKMEAVGKDKPKVEIPPTTNSDDSATRAFEVILNAGISAVKADHPPSEKLVTNNPASLAVGNRKEKRSARKPVK